MSPFVEFPWLTVFVIAIAVMVLLNALSPKRPPQIGAPRSGGPIGVPPPPPPLEKRICFFCKAEQAPYASFCKACGKRL